MVHVTFGVRQGWKLARSGDGWYRLGSLAARCFVSGVTSVVTPFLRMAGRFNDACLVSRIPRRLITFAASALAPAHRLQAETEAPHRKVALVARRLFTDARL